MNENEFVVKPVYGDVPEQPIVPGQLLIDCDHEKLYASILEESDNYDNTFDKAILKEEFVYLPEFPSNLISYTEMLELGKEKYYWDSLDQQLYRFLVRDDVEPFVRLSQTAVGTEGNPTQVISTLVEFSKSDGVWNEVELEVATSNYIVVHGYPSQYAERPYLENTYYYDDVHDTYYTFTSNYTLNINNLYYDKTIEETSVLQYDYDNSRWTTVNAALNVDGNPNEVYHIVDGDTGSSDDTDINTIDQEIYYCDRVADIIYWFNYGRYFLEVDYTGTIYERIFEFYRELQTPYYDVNSTGRINGKKLYYFYRYLKNIEDPQEDRIYFDTKTQKMYTYKDGVWTKVEQDNIIIPQMFFPHTNLDIN